MEPAVFLRWSKAKACWELWSELRYSAHPDATNERAKSDRWNTEHQCWMRFFQNYRHADGRFAHADRALITGLEMADAWANRKFYEEHIEAPEQAREAAQLKTREQLMSDAARYYHGIPNPIIAPHARGGKADWRQGGMY